jgi:hypothetical protein
MLKLKAFVMPIALALAPSITAAFDASAQSLQKACDIQELRTGYQSLSDKVEGVSPDMSSYIKREGKKALELGNEQRFNNLLAQVSEPAYYAVEFHEEISELQSYLTAADEAKSTDDKIIGLADALNVAGNAQDDLNSYVDADARRGNRRLLSRDDVRKLFFESSYLRGRLSVAIKCIVWHLNERR